MAVPVGLNVWSRLVEATFPYLDRTAAPFDSLWLPDHLQYAGHNVAEGWSLLAWTLARYPDKLCGHEVLCNSFRNPAHLAKMAATLQALSGGRLVLGIGAGWNEEEYRAYGWPFPPARVRIAPLAEAIELVRTPDQVTETLLSIVAQGADRLTVNLADVPHPEGTWLFAATVLPRLQEA